MGMLENMYAEIDCVESIFMECISSKEKTDVFIFFEGKDDYKYYLGRIKPYISSKKYYNFCCESKKNVLKTYNMISEHSTINDEKMTLYFVDSDYDGEYNNQISDDIFVTTSYSIENYYFTDDALETILYTIFGFSCNKENDRKDFTELLKNLKQYRDNVIKNIIYSNAWLSLQVKESRKVAKKVNLCELQNYEKIKDISCIEDLEKLVSNCFKFSEEDIQKEIEVLKKDPINKIKGKYLGEMMLKELRRLIRDSNKKNIRDICSIKRNVKSNLQDFMLELSSCASTPIELTDYIKKRLKITS